MRRLHTLLTCNWFAIAFHCWRKGHDWHTYRVCKCLRLTTCRYCGYFRGWQRV